MIYNINTYTYIKIHKHSSQEESAKNYLLSRKKENYNGFKVIRPCFKLVHLSITQYKTGC